MARAKIPNPLERRHQVEQKLPAERALAIAELYLEEGRCVEAVDYLALAEAGEKLGELRERAVGEGDVFLLRSVARAQGEAPRREEWERIAGAAEGRGLEAYAAEARRQAERGED